MKPLNIFIGYDSKEILAYNVLSHSIVKRSSIPISLAPIALHQIRSIYTRPRGPTESTEFSISRFLVPYLSDYEGYSVFMDCDMLCLSDVAELIPFIESQKDKAVLVCKHKYTPKSDTKFLNQIQTKYPRKNWSSLIIFNNKKCKALTPEYVNSASGLDLHRFKWLKNDQIGSLPLEWNWLVGEYEKKLDIKILHYTIGGPWFKNYMACDYAEEWFREQYDMSTFGKLFP